MAHGEPWVWRYKDIRGWWANRHHERVGGVRQGEPTPGCRVQARSASPNGLPAVDKGTNQPNKFLDPGSSESALPHHSDGRATT